MCGPQLGLVIAERAALGEPTFVSTSLTMPSGSERSSVSAISWIRCDASCSDVPGGSRT